MKKDNDHCDSIDEKVINEAFNMSHSFSQAGSGK